MLCSSTTQKHEWSTVWKWYCGNAALLILFCLVPVWIRTALHQYHNYDLGIFAQALHGIRAGCLNPFIPGLNIPLFCDHFDPILILASPLGKIFEPAYAALIVEHLLVLLTPLPVIMAYRGDRGSTPYVCFAVTYLLFNRGIMSAVTFPVHPTTWASFFVVTVGVCVTRRRWGWVFLAALLLMACKEEFPFVILMIAVSLAFRKNLRVGLSLGLLASFWMVLAFSVRPWLVGSTHGYASRVLSPLLEAPLATVWERIRSIGEAKRLFQSLLPLIPAACWIFARRSRMDWTMALAVLPLLAIRFLDGAWKFHYLAPVAPLLLLAVSPSEVATRLPRRHAALGIVLTAALALSTVSKGVGVYARVGEFRGDRYSQIERARLHLLQNEGGKALVEGNLTPLLARRGDVFQIGGVQPSQEYRFLLAEKPPNGDPWPVSHSDIDQLISMWRSDDKVTVLTDEDHVFLAEKRNPSAR